MREGRGKGADNGKIPAEQLFAHQSFWEREVWFLQEVKGGRVREVGPKVFTSNSFGLFCGVSEYQLNAKWLFNFEPESRKKR